MREEKRERYRPRWPVVEHQWAKGGSVVVSVGLGELCGGLVSLAVGDATMEHGGGELAAWMVNMVVRGWLRGVRAKPVTR